MSYKRYMMLFLMLAMTIVTGCASVKFDGTENRLPVLPSQVGRDGGPDTGVVVWGGRILSIDNIEEGSVVQVLAVPLNGSNVPQVEQRSVGRFVAYYPGFLEPQDYAPGRWISLAGELDGFADAQVDEYVMSVPYVRVRQIHLWPRYPDSWNPNVNFGVGVGVDL